ncbi:rhodanese-like domain-containing protein [Ditylenchus destructor]|uniref:M-phase inducer phosphatase n=1 Tax=Ditylenchus destructor TaxID=166010 RepID=A0AAD4RBQ3_9BILA|nr:rhodanese-like domain-containing protein [Ditylenchus destructor]
MDSADSIFCSTQDADSTLFENTSRASTDFGFLAENRQKHEHQGMKVSTFRRSLSMIQENRISHVSKSATSKSVPVWLLHAERGKANSWNSSTNSSTNDPDTENNHWRRTLFVKPDGETQKTPAFSKVFASLCRRTRPLPFRDITNTPQSGSYVGSAKSFKKSPLSQHSTYPKVTRKRPIMQEKKMKKRRKNNDSVFLSGNEGNFVLSPHTSPPVHLPSFPESSGGPEHAASLSSPESSMEFTLKTVGKPQKAHGAFRSISADTLCELLSSMSDEEFNQKFLLVDCRYPFEYNGGHIRHAVNIFDPSKIEEIFYPETPQCDNGINSKIPIFYCEYSQVRGPCMARELRKLDRARNEHQYPFVNYKEIYLLDRGYKQFYDVSKYVEFCEPKNYIPMHHEDYEAELERFHFHKRKRTVLKTQQTSIDDYFKVRKISSATPRKQSKMKAETLRNHFLIAKDTVNIFGYCGLTESPISSTSTLTSGSSDIQLPPLLSSLTMTSPNSSSANSSLTSIVRLGRRLFSFNAINEVASPSSSPSEPSCH